MRIVQKYGGTSLGDAEKVMNAARRAVALARQGIQVVVVVSAQGDTTDAMIQKARQLNRRGSLREMDAYLACGEQMSAALMAMAIGALGWPALSLTGAQAGIETDSVHGNARIVDIKPRRIVDALEAGKIVVAAGFQGLNSAGDVTTLGRGGSDTTAVALAAAMGADKCQIFTDVDGVYDRDPRIHADARKFARIGYGDMLTLVENGAQVLHDRSVELARDNGLKIEVLSAFADTPGTIVGD